MLAALRILERKLYGIEHDGGECHCFREGKEEHPLRGNSRRDINEVVSGLTLITYARKEPWFECHTKA